MFEVFVFLQDLLLNNVSTVTKKVSYIRTYMTRRLIEHTGERLTKHGLS